MKFSVLLPTRNRLELLKYAVESVRRQDYADWEIVVSDNDSEEDIAGYVASLQEPRVRYVRTAEFIAVTDNWNNALNASTGEYVIMLGDDDALAPGYFTAMKRLIEEYQPDCIYHSAYLYTYPNVVPGNSNGSLEPYGYACFLNTPDAPRREPFWIERSEADYVAHQALNFRVEYGFNMQFVLVSREFIASLREKGPFFQSPFPDYYAMNVMFLRSARILADPHPRVMIGVSPKSYGFFHNNARDKEGAQFLKGIPSPEIAARLKRVLLPGNNIFNGWLAAVETVRANCPEIRLTVNYRRYRLLQTVHVYHGYRAHGTVSLEDYQELMGKLNLAEKISFGASTLLLKFLPKIIRGARGAQMAQRYRSKLLGAFPAGERWAPQQIPGRYQNMLDVYEALEARQTTEG